MILSFALVGMPGSGKTTIGRMAAEALGMPFYDSDEIVEASLKAKIPDVFRLYGESFFRIRETEVVESIIKIPGAILSLGGGAGVFNEALIKSAKTAKVLWLDRSLENIMATIGFEGRPLLDSKARLYELYSKRGEIYRRMADYAIENNSSIESAVERVRQIAKQ